MKKTYLTLLATLLLLTTLQGQTTLSGIVKASGTNSPLPGVTVTLMQQNISTQTNALGEFYFMSIQDGREEVYFSRSGYFPHIVTTKIEPNKENKMATIVLQIDLQEETRQDAILQLSESDFSEDEGRAAQSIASALSDDVYLSQTSYSFSPMRFRPRGYDQELSATYINGVHFNVLDRGGFNYSSLGGLNHANRNKDVTYGIAPNTFSFGGLGSTTNILNRASAMSAGTRGSVAYTNRAYKLRGQYTYATGVMENGWALAASAVVRWADEGMVEGTFYNSIGYFLAADKILNNRHTLSIVTYGAPTQRAQQSAGVQEVFDMAKTINYNAYWGYQNGQKRNSRVVKSFDPTLIINHDFNISRTQKLRSGLGMHYSQYSNSALSFYNAPDPRPDYYRNLPSFQASEEMREYVRELWQSDPSVSQINWKALYQANYRNNAVNPNGSSKYILERRHNDLAEVVFNSLYTHQVSNQFKLTAGVEAKYAKDFNYKTIDDLLGGNQWIDIDQFAERDFPNNKDITQNDMNNPNRVVRKGDVFGYNYDINILHSALFLQNEWKWNKIDLYYAGKITFSQFNRESYMRNGRAPNDSYGVGKKWWFIDPSLKAGVTYKVDGRNRLYANFQAESKAPIPNNAFVSQRVKSTIVPNLKSRKIISYDLNYAFNYKRLRGRISAYRTDILGTTDNLGYYDDALRTFVNHLLSKSNKRYQGIEAGVMFKINNSFSVSTAGSFADYRYTNDAIGIKSAENGSKEDIVETIKTKDLKINAGPQLAANITLDYFHPKMWFADVTLNYFDNNYLDFAPNRFTEENVATYTTPDAKKMLGTQEKLKGGFMLDFSIGKLIYLPNRNSLNVNLSFNNVLNNTQMVTGGYQQARIPLDRDKNLDTSNLGKFPNKYYYAWGFNMFLNVGFRF